MLKDPCLVNFRKNYGLYVEGKKSSHPYKLALCSFYFLRGLKSSLPSDVTSDNVLPFL